MRFRTFSPKTQKQQKQRSIAGSSIVEFGPVTFVFFIIFVFPLINLTQFACGAAIVFLIATQAATTAASSPDFVTALSSARSCASNLANSGFGEFAHLSPANPYGITLYVEQTNIGTGQTTNFGPDSPAGATVDTTANIYEIEADAVYNIGPFLNMSSAPFVGNIPLIGKPAQICFTVTRNDEYPEGLTSNNPVGSVPASAGAGARANPTGFGGPDIGMGKFKLNAPTGQNIQGPPVADHLHGLDGPADAHSRSEDPSREEFAGPR
jgi:hypothetical protein